MILSNYEVIDKNDIFSTSDIIEKIMTATIRDVAKLANVSVATVSRVLNGTAKVNEETKNAVLKAQKELDFHLNSFARTLATKESNTIGVLVSDISDPFFALMIKACDQTARSFKKGLIITQGFYDEKKEVEAIENLLSHQCCGIIAHLLAMSDEKLSSYMKKYPYIVLINRRLKGFEDRCVNIDNISAMKALTEYLVGLGHKKFVYIDSEFDIADAKERLEGFLQTLNNHSLSIDDKYILKTKPYSENAVKTANTLIEMGIDKFSAIVCYNDSIAMSIINVFLNHGIKIPEDVSVTGFDDLFFASVIYPSLTTVQNPIEKMGQEAVKLSFARFKKDETFSISDFETKIQCRNSVKKL